MAPFSLYLLLFIFLTVAGGKKDLNILVMAPFSNDLSEVDESWNIGPALVPAARLAVDHINQRDDLLQGYKLNVLERESGCTLSSKTLINLIEAEFYSASEMGIVGMIGPGCHKSVIATADLSQTVLNVVQISISSSLAIRGANYYNSFRTVPAAPVYVDAFRSLMATAGWKKVEVMYDNHNGVYGSVLSEMHKTIGRKSLHAVEIRPAVFGHSFVRDALKEVDGSNVRIILALVGLSMAQMILCEKHKLASQVIDFQLVFMDIEPEDVWNVDFFANRESLGCTAEDMKEALNNTIFITNRHQRSNTTDNNTYAGISYQSYQKLYEGYRSEYLMRKNMRIESLPFSNARYFNAYYDAVWALAIALNHTATEFDLTSYNKLSEANASKNGLIGKYLNRELNNLSFEGMSGPIHFNKITRDVSSLGVTLEQFILSAEKTNKSKLATFVGENLTFYDNFYLSSYTLNTKHRVADRIIGFGVLILALLAVIGFITLQVAFWFFNIAPVKASSPQLNYLTLSGCCFYLAALLLFTMQELFPSELSQKQIISGVICNLQIWSFSFAFSLIFGTVCVKTWRIYRIFTHFKQGRVKYVSDIFLIGFVVFLLLTDLLYLIIWTLTNPWSWHSDTMREGQVLVDSHRCICDNFAYWSTALLLQKLTLMFLAILLSILVKPVKRKGFKNTKAILILTYSLIIIHVVGICIYVLLNILQTLHILRFLGYALTFALSLITVTLSQFLTHVWPNLKKNIVLKVPKVNTAIDSQRVCFLSVKPYEETSSSAIL